MGIFKKDTKKKEEVAEATEKKVQTLRGGRSTTVFQARSVRKICETTQEVQGSRCREYC